MNTTGIRDQLTRAAVGRLADSLVAGFREANQQIAVDVADCVVGIIGFHSLSPTRQRALAHHEAGHAIAELALLPLGSFTSVSVQPRFSEQALGIVRPAPGTKALQTKGAVVRELWCLAAGGAAEELVTGRRNLAAEADDLRQAHRLLLKAAPTLDIEARIAAIEGQRGAVKAMLRERWPAVEAVAEALQSTGDRDYASVKLLVDALQVRERLATLDAAVAAGRP